VLWVTGYALLGMTVAVLFALFPSRWRSEVSFARRDITG
jgi:hypothetical protein